jgi:type IV secretion system protein VirD4
VLALDPKGELARLTKAERERNGHDCFIIDPFGANRRYPSASYNPLAEIDPNSRNAVDDAAMIADALVIHEGTGESHWTDAAKLLIRALVLLVLTMPEEERDLVSLRALLMLTHPLLAHADSFDPADIPPGMRPREYGLFGTMAERTGIFDDVLAAAGEAFLAMGPGERSSVISTARTQTGFLDSVPLRATLRGNSFRLADLKRRKVTVYLCLPAGRMATHAKWFRIIINLALTVFEHEEAVPDPPVLMVLEEFPVLGYMPRVETAAGQIASFGVKLWIVLQDLTQLQRHYRESWETFLGNAGTVTFFGNSDVTTLKYISEKLGSRGFKLVEQSRAGLAAQLGGASPLVENLRVDPLLAPHEIERHFARETRRVLVLVQGSRPVVLRRADYRKDEAFAGMFSE